MIFLSASIPDPKRNEKYYNSADVIAIRDAVRALATIVIPKSYLVWGGHPAISPLIRYVITTMDMNVQNHITLYQSDFSEIFSLPITNILKTLFLHQKFMTEKVVYMKCG